MPFAQERHGFQHPPKLFLLGDEENAANPLGKTGGYNPDNMEVTIYVSGRHPKDILRSLSHELVHHNQNERGDFSDMVSTALGYAQEDPHMRNMEGEAYREGNLCFRDWEDGRKKQLQESIYYETIIGGEDMSKKTPLKEWKDNEINARLMKKFGLMKEEGTAGNDIVVKELDQVDDKQINEDEDEDEGGDDDDDEDDSSDESESTNESLTTLHNDIAQLLQEENPPGTIWTVHKPGEYGGTTAGAKELEKAKEFYKPWFAQDESEWKQPGIRSLSAKQQREDPVHVEEPSVRDTYTDWLHQHQLGPQHATEAGLPWYHWKQFVPTMQQDPKHLGYQESSPGYFGQYDDWRGDIPFDITPYTLIDAIGIGGALKGAGKAFSKLARPKWQSAADDIARELADETAEEAVQTAVRKGGLTIDDAYKLGLTSDEAKSMGIQLTDEMAGGLDDYVKASRPLEQAAHAVPAEVGLADEIAGGIKGRYPAVLKNLTTGAKEVAGAGGDFLLGRTGGTLKSFPSVYKGQLLWLPLTSYYAYHKVSQAADRPGGLAEFFVPEQGPMETEEEWKDRQATLEHLQEIGMEDAMEWRTDVDLWELADKDPAEFQRLKRMQDKAMTGELGNILVISGPAELEFYRQDLERLGIGQSEEETPKRNDGGRKMYEDTPPIWEELYEASELDDDYYNTLFEEIKYTWTKESKE